MKSQFPTLFAAADIPYFIEHGIAFAKSVAQSGNQGHVMVFPNMDRDFKTQIEEYAEALKQVVDIADKVKFQCVDPKFYLSLYDRMQVDDIRAFYASMRFLLLPYIYVDGPILTLDIDSLVKKPINIAPEYDIGLFLREDNVVGSNDYERQGMKVAAGCIYTTTRAKEFVDITSNTLIANPVQWFCDQIALYTAYNVVKEPVNGKELKILKFDNTFLNWDFDNPSDAPIDTAKGNRKSHPNFLAAKHKYLES